LNSIINENGKVQIDTISTQFSLCEFDSKIDYVYYKKAYSTSGRNKYYTDY